MDSGIHVRRDADAYPNADTAYTNSYTTDTYTDSNATHTDTNSDAAYTDPNTTYADANASVDTDTFNAGMRKCVPYTGASFGLSCVCGGNHVRERKNRAQQHRLLQV